ncbi:OLC1v1021684C1 [Oldenlandia corymbosa var. corymbosa]|uniref:Aspergillus nuclease S1 n=1 Tax=Oldenlandia corymbosa var. corymbosa TaxID=529605 RepID=A0AAV1BWT2_OLDCO|nr:OLC1v1021684C1 [Oldenlandia corymbosa var. corymbosa]
MIGSNFWWFGRLLVLLVLIPQIYGWGKEGHIATCKIAEGLLTEEAAAGVQSLLPESAEGDFSSVCPWADTMRFHYYWSRALHYADTPDFRCNYSYCRDCHDNKNRKDRCVTGAIFNYTNQLMSRSDPQNTHNLTEALMFLGHFMGDAHQPLHCGFIGDEGGNSINLRWFKRKANLHHVWDTLMIETAMKTYYNRDLDTMIESIQRNISNGGFDDISSWDKCNATVCPNQYASESVNLACRYAYRNATPGVTLGDEYFDSRLPVMEKRLAQGGIRLAAVLNRIFSTSLPLAAE